MLIWPFVVPVSIRTIDAYRRHMPKATKKNIIDFVAHFFLATSYRQAWTATENLITNLGPDVPIFRGDDAYRLRFNWQSWLCVCLWKRKLCPKRASKFEMSNAAKLTPATCSGNFQETNWTTQVTPHIHIAGPNLRAATQSLQSLIKSYLFIQPPFSFMPCNYWMGQANWCRANIWIYNRSFL